MQELAQGTEVTKFHNGKAFSIHKVERTTKTQAILPDGTRLQIKVGPKGALSVVGETSWNAVDYQLTDESDRSEVRLRIARNRALQELEQVKAFLLTENLEYINSIRTAINPFIKP